MNFQNIPRDDKVVKRAFVPRPGNVFHMFDFQKIEPCLLAYFAAKKGDPSLAAKIRDGYDPYVAILSAMYGDDITPEQRTEGKILFLSLMYGGGARTIMLQFNISQAEAKAMIREFHKSLPVVRRLQDGVVATAQARGYIRTPWGRHLHLEEYGEHKLLNKLIQGSAAHLMKRAMIFVDDALQGAVTEWGVGNIMGLSVVHDEIILEGPHSEAKRMHEAIPYLMTTVACGDTDIMDVVPIRVDHEVAVTSMADKRDYAEYIQIPY
jgi:DNA polymerase-1